VQKLLRSFSKSVAFLVAFVMAFSVVVFTPTQKVYAAMSTDVINANWTVNVYDPDTDDGEYPDVRNNPVWFVEVLGDNVRFNDDKLEEYVEGLMGAGSATDIFRIGTTATGSVGVSAETRGFSAQLVDFATVMTGGALLSGTYPAEASGSMDIRLVFKLTGGDLSFSPNKGMMINIPRGAFTTLDTASAGSQACTGRLTDGADKLEILPIIIIEDADGNEVDEDNELVFSGIAGKALDAPFVFTIKVLGDTFRHSLTAPAATAIRNLTNLPGSTNNTLDGLGADEPTVITGLTYTHSYPDEVTSGSDQVTITITGTPGGVVPETTFAMDIPHLSTPANNFSLMHFSGAATASVPAANSLSPIIIDGFTIEIGDDEPVFYLTNPDDAEAGILLAKNAPPRSKEWTLLVELGKYRALGSSITSGPAANQITSIFPAIDEDIINWLSYDGGTSLSTLIDGSSDASLEAYAHRTGNKNAKPANGDTSFEITIIQVGEVDDEVEDGDEAYELELTIPAGMLYTNTMITANIHGSSIEADIKDDKEESTSILVLDPIKLPAADEVDVEITGFVGRYFEETITFIIDGQIHASWNTGASNAHTTSRAAWLPGAPAGISAVIDSASNIPGSTKAMITLKISGNLNAAADRAFGNIVIPRVTNNGAATATAIQSPNATAQVGGSASTTYTIKGSADSKWEITQSATFGTGANFRLPELELEEEFPDLLDTAKRYYVTITLGNGERFRAINPANNNTDVTGWFQNLPPSGIAGDAIAAAALPIPINETSVTVVLTGEPDDIITGPLLVNIPGAWLRSNNNLQVTPRAEVAWKFKEGTGLIMDAASIPSSPAPATIGEIPFGGGIVGDTLNETITNIAIYVPGEVTEVDDDDFSLPGAPRGAELDIDAESDVTLEYDPWLNRTLIKIAAMTIEGDVEESSSALFKLGFKDFVFVSADEDLDVWDVVGATGAATSMSAQWQVGIDLPGTTNSPYITLTLPEGLLFTQVAAGDNVSGWFDSAAQTTFPLAGVTAEVRTLVAAAGSRTLQIAFRGTPQEVKDDLMEIVIPSASIQAGTKNIPVIENAALKFNFGNDHVTAPGTLSGALNTPYESTINVTNIDGHAFNLSEHKGHDISAWMRSTPQAGLPAGLTATLKDYAFTGSGSTARTSMEIEIKGTPTAAGKTAFVLVIPRTTWIPAKAANYKVIGTTHADVWNITAGAALSLTRGRTDNWVVGSPVHTGTVAANAPRVTVTLTGDNFIALTAASYDGGTNNGGVPGNVNGWFAVGALPAGVTATLSGNVANNATSAIIEFSSSTNNLAVAAVMNALVKVTIPSAALQGDANIVSADNSALRFIVTDTRTAKLDNPVIHVWESAAGASPLSYNNVQSLVLTGATFNNVTGSISGTANVWFGNGAGVLTASDDAIAGFTATALTRIDTVSQNDTLLIQMGMNVDTSKTLDYVNGYELDLNIPISGMATGNDNILTVNKALKVMPIKATLTGDIMAQRNNQPIAGADTLTIELKGDVTFDGLVQGAQVGTWFTDTSVTTGAAPFVNYAAADVVVASVSPDNQKAVFTVNRRFGNATLPNANTEYTMSVTIPANRLSIGTPSKKIDAPVDNLKISTTAPSADPVRLGDELQSGSMFYREAALKAVTSANLWLHVVFKDTTLGSNLVKVGTDTTSAIITYGTEGALFNVTYIDSNIQGMPNLNNPDTYEVIGTAETPPANTAALAAELQKANGILEAAHVEPNDTVPGDIALGAHYWLQADFDLFEAAITNAENALAIALSQKAINDALIALEDAGTDFATARKTGTNPGIANTTELDAQILIAEGLRDDAVVKPNSTTTNDVPEGDVYWLQADWDALVSAITDAKAVRDATEPSQGDVDTAESTLKGKITAFNNAKKTGTGTGRNGMHLDNGQLFWFVNDVKTEGFQTVYNESYERNVTYYFDTLNGLFLGGNYREIGGKGYIFNPADGEQLQGVNLLVTDSSSETFYAQESSDPLERYLLDGWHEFENAEAPGGVVSLYFRPGAMTMYHSAFLSFGGQAGDPGYEAYYFLPNGWQFNAGWINLAAAGATETFFYFGADGKQVFGQLIETGTADWYQYPHEDHGMQVRAGYHYEWLGEYETGYRTIGGKEYYFEGVGGFGTEVSPTWPSVGGGSSGSVFNVIDIEDEEIDEAVIEEEAVEEEIIIEYEAIEDEDDAA